MRNLKKFLVITAAFVMMFCNILQAFAAARYIKPEMVNTEAVKTTGLWNKNADGHWSFTPNGEEAVKDGWFYLNSSNTSTEYKWYCFDENGIMRTGWIIDKNDPSTWYYAGENKDAAEGSMITGWITDPQDGKKYYLDPATGIMVHGWRQIDGKWYYFGERQYADRSWTPDNTGHMTAGAKGTHSYGSMYANEYTPDGYYVGPDGVWNGISSGSSSSGRHDPVVKTYTVTFNMNGHGTAPGPQKARSGSTISEPTPQPSAEGYVFGGWFKESACINRWNFAVDKVTANITLFAKWSENDHITITYQSEASNKGTVSPTSESLNPVVGTATGSKASPSDGYRFINWTDAAGNVSGTSETFVPEKKDGKYAEETYTAHFEALTYKVTFKGNVIGYTDQTIDETYDTNYILPAKSPIKTGYAFAGWYTATEEGTEITADTVVKITEDTDLYAQYVPLTYQTVFYGNYEGSDYAETVSECYDSNFVLPETTPERTGYTFNGWWTKNEGGNQITTETKVDASIRKAYAHWIADTHNVTAQVAGSHGSASARIGETEVTKAKTDENVTFVAVSDTGYEFDYWEVVSGGIEIDSVKTDNPITVTMPAAALTLKAHFKAIVPGEYNIILEDDGHGTAMAKVGDNEVTSAAPESSVTLIATPNEGYVFKEWNIIRGIESSDISDNTFTMPSNEVKIKAIFEREYTVEVTAQGHGSISTDITKGVSGTEVTLTVTPEDGYKLDSLSVERGGISITDNKFTIGSADVKIKAVFVADTPDTYSIILEDDGHGLAIAKVDDSEVTSAAPSASVTLIATPNEGYAFKEWNIVRGLSNGAITDNTFTMPSNEVKIKAIFDRAYNINVQVQGHGSASAAVDGQTTTCARKNASVTLTATPEDGYELKEWIVVSGDIAISNNAFTMPESNVTVKAVFSETLDPGLWIPMRANDKYGSPIDFYPAFKYANEVEGYKFAVKDGNVFTEISNTDISMEKIYQALQLGTGTTTTLYYAKTDSEAPELKGYTVKDFSWNEVFEAYESSYPAKATGYVNGFKTFYQGIVTAEIGDVTDNKYGSDWDATPERVPKINGVFYKDFYNSYGGNYGGILSHTSNLPWCSTIASIANAYAFSTNDVGVRLEPRSKMSGVVLCKSFGTDAPVKYNITLDNDGHGTAVAKVDGSVVTSAAAGETVKLTVTPSDGYDFESWEPTPNTLVIGTDNTFIMPECDVTVKANFEEASYYAVCIWDIEEEPDGSQKIIFGPATGADYDSAIGNAKEIEDDWDTISANAAAGTAQQIYSTALAEGHIKKIKITLNNDIFSGTKPTGTFSTFHTSIKSDYRKWNGTYSSSDCESTNYATSRIRATLNGGDGWDPSSYAGENLLNDSNCLLSCFPEDLQRNIVVRESDIPTNWTINSPYTINSYEKICDKLWLANANEIYGNCDVQYKGDEAQFEKNKGKSSISAYKVYSESGTAQYCWLRSPNRFYRYQAAHISFNGQCSSNDVSSTQGISPFFIIGGSAPKTYSYNLESGENGTWKQDEAPMESFETTDAAVPVVDGSGSITYTGTDGQEHTVTATPNTGYTFKECSYDTNTKTYTASFETISYDIGCAIDGQDETYEVIISHKEETIDSPITISGTGWYYSAFRQIDGNNSCIGLYVLLKKGGAPSSTDHDYAVKIWALDGYQLTNCKFGDIQVTGNTEAPHTGQVTASQNLTAEVEPVPVVTTYTLETDGHGTWQEVPYDVTSFKTTDRPEPGKTITYKDTDGIQHEVKATPKQGFSFKDCIYDADAKTFTATFEETNSLSMFNLQPEDEELSEEALDPEVIIEDIPTGEEIIEEDEKTHEFNEVETENTSKMNEPEEEITTDGKSNEDNPDEKPIENLPSAGIINSDPANSSETKEKPQNDSTEQTEHQ